MITITRRLPVINGFVRVPDVGNKALTSVTPADAISLLTDAEEAEIVAQDFIEFPQYDIESGPSEDWFGAIREAV